ncbi:MAG: DUF5317 family protein [Clostridium sp.]
MIETILLAIVIAKLKGYKIKALFKTWTIYPVLCLELILVFFQINTFIGNYKYIEFAPIFKSIYMYTLLIPLFTYKLYLSGFIGSICIFIGTLMNRFVMTMNGGKMPVYPSLSYLTGYVKYDSFDKVKDIHILGSQATNYKVFTDFIDLGYSILSIGDVFIRVFVFIIIYNLIKATNSKSTNK